MCQFLKIEEYILYNLYVIISIINLFIKISMLDNGSSQN